MAGRKSNLYWSYFARVAVMNPSLSFAGRENKLARLFEL